GDDWVNTKRFTNSAGNTTRVTRGDQGGMISRRGPDGSGFVGARGDNVYAGRDGNVYRRDQNGNWSKWDNGSWNSANRPEQRNSAGRDSMLNDRARQSERARGDRIGQPSAGTMDRGTMGSLERDRAARSSGAQRSRDFGSYSRSPNRGSVGGYGGSRGGGGFRGGGGGFRGGGRRR
ncbi:MAG TPA: hypothetical protein VFT44_03280, partial [Pyrinomonadaceae bacterium]|nr:hypothetical protein [Pyrinomonadaceae bacterium]